MLFSKASIDDSKNWIWKKKIGIVAVLYNSGKLLFNFFDSLKRQMYSNFVLYIVDNGYSSRFLPKLLGKESDRTYKFGEPIKSEI